MRRDAFSAAEPAPIEVIDPQEIEPLVVSLATAARLLGVSDRHIRSHLHEIPHVRLGGRLLFRVESLRTWLDQCERNSVVTSKPVASPEGGK